MAFVRPASEVPKDAIIMDQNEAAEYAWDVIYEWKELSDVWALRYGSMILGGINAMSGVIMNMHYRRKLKLGNYGHFSSVIPLSVMPGMLTILFHRYLISTDILLMKNQQCPVCYELRSAAIQGVLGTSYPMVLAPTAALMLANRYNTYRVPDLREGPKVMFKFLAKITKPLSGTLTTLTLIQVAASSVITYFEMKNNITVRGKIMELEKEVLGKRAQ